MSPKDLMIIRALTATDEKIRVCKNHFTSRWLTIQHQRVIAETKEYPPALAVARAQAFKLPRARDTDRTKHVVVEAIGHRRGSSSGHEASGVPRIR